MLKETTKNLFIGIARTAAPILAGIVLTFFTSIGLDIPEENKQDVIMILFGLMTLGYYVVVALAERYISPKAGWLLGVAKKPEYIQTVSDNVGTLGQPVQRFSTTLDHEEGRAG
jgi:hypothetical protein